MLKLKENFTIEGGHSHNDGDDEQQSATKNCVVSRHKQLTWEEIASAGDSTERNAVTSRALTMMRSFASDRQASRWSLNQRLDSRNA